MKEAGAAGGMDKSSDVMASSAIGDDSVGATETIVPMHDQKNSEATPWRHLLLTVE